MNRVNGSGAGAHPEVAARLAEEMHALANLVTTADVETFVGDDVFSATERLQACLETVLEAAQAERRLRE
jgi:hypothetical protein